MMAFGKGKFVLFVCFTEEQIDISDWFSVNVMVTILMGVGVSLDLVKSSNAVLVITLPKKLSLCSAYLITCACAILGLLRLKQEFIISNLKTTEN